MCKKNIFLEKNKKNFKKGIKYLKIAPIYITSKSKVILLGGEIESVRFGFTKLKKQKILLRYSTSRKMSTIQGGIIMGMVVQHNMTSMNANRNLGISVGNLAKSTEKLSSGYKINRAGDNAAGLAISEKMRGQIRGLDQASSNAQDGISLIQTAEGALTETHSIIQRMRELAVQSASDTNTDDDRTQIQNEINQLTQEVDRIANTTEFNTKKLLNGDRRGALSAKAGTGKVEGTFAKADVFVATKPKNEAGEDQFSLTGKTDVIRIEFKRDLTAADQFTTNNAEIKSVFGTGASVTLDSSGKITIASAKYDKADLGYTADTTASIDFTVSGNVESIKAGDVITITLGEATKSKEAEGKDSLRLQIGANAGQEVALGINSMRTDDLKISKDGNALKVDKQKDASMAIEAYDLAIQKVSTERAKMGAMQNRLEHTISNLDTSAENLQSAESSLRDTDMAEEMTRFSKSNILQQAGQSMLAQANQSNQGVLSLLG